MPWTIGHPERGRVMVGGEMVDISQVVTEQDRFIEMSDGSWVQANLKEVLRSDDETNNRAILTIEGRVIKGHTYERRVRYEEPERQNVFRADDGSLEFVISSSRVRS